MSTKKNKPSRVSAKNDNLVWIAIQSLLNDYGRGGEWYKHVEFTAKVIAEMTDLSLPTVRQYLNKAVEDGKLARYDVSGRSHVYMFERYNAD